MYKQNKTTAVCLWESISGGTDKQMLILEIKNMKISGKNKLFRCGVAHGKCTLQSINKLIIERI